MIDDCGLITIAVGRKYISQAKYLAYSCMLHAPHIIRAVITDQPDLLSPYYDIRLPLKKEYGNPFEVKTRLPLYTPFEKTLYVDTDSLVIHNIDSYWKTLEEQSFVYEGKMITEGEWYLDIGKLIQQTAVPWIPKFNSGMFLFKKDEKVSAIFDTAYDYLVHQKERNLGVAFFRKEMLPDEPFLAIALAKYREKPVEDHGRFSRTLIGAVNIHINVVKGVAFFIKNNRMVFPLIVHFCGRFGRFLFFGESVKLFFYFNPPLTMVSTAILSLLRKMWKCVFRKICP
jgi:hypothetical protein